MDKRKDSRKQGKRQSVHYMVTQDAGGIVSLDLSGSMSFSYPGKKRSGRPRSDESERLIEQIREFKSLKKPIWPLAKQHWPNLPARKAIARLYAFVSKHRAEIDRRL